jgi:hypothetical protein
MPFERLSEEEFEKLGVRLTARKVACLTREQYPKPCVNFAETAQRAKEVYKRDREHPIHFDAWVIDFSALGGSRVTARGTAIEEDLNGTPCFIVTSAAPTLHITEPGMDGLPAFSA